MIDAARGAAGARVRLGEGVEHLAALHSLRGFPVAWSLAVTLGFCLTLGFVLGANHKICTHMTAQTRTTHRCHLFPPGGGGGGHFDVVHMTLGGVFWGFWDGG